jgi:hypothetical protein
MSSSVDDCFVWKDTSETGGCGAQVVSLKMRSSTLRLPKGSVLTDDFCTDGEELSSCCDIENNEKIGEAYQCPDESASESPLKKRVVRLPRGLKIRWKKYAIPIDRVLDIDPECWTVNNCCATPTKRMIDSSGVGSNPGHAITGLAMRSTKAILAALNPTLGECQDAEGCPCPMIQTECCQGELPARIRVTFVRNGEYWFDVVLERGWEGSPASNFWVKRGVSVVNEEIPVPMPSSEFTSDDFTIAAYMHCGFGGLWFEFLFEGTVYSSLYDPLGYAGINCRRAGFVTDMAASFVPCPEILCQSNELVPVSSSIPGCDYTFLGNLYAYFTGA